MVSDGAVPLLWQQQKIVIGIPPEKSRLMLSVWRMSGVRCSCSLPSFLSSRPLVLKVALAWGMDTLPVVRFQHGDEINFYLPCKWAHRVISSFSLFPLASKRD